MNHHLIRQALAVLAAVTLVAVVGATSAAATYTPPSSTTSTEAPAADPCDPTQRPGGTSLAKWLDSLKYTPGDCFDYQHVHTCGTLDVRIIRNLTPFGYSVRWAEGDTVPDNPSGDGGFLASWPEGYSDGSVQVTFWIVGAEKDYIVGHGWPNWWERIGTTVEIDTYCAPPPGTSTTTPAATSTTSTIVETFTPTTVPDLVETVEPVTDPTSPAAPAPRLPDTGVSSQVLAMAALMLVAVGAMLMATRRR